MISVEELGGPVAGIAERRSRLAARLGFKVSPSAGSANGMGKTRRSCLGFVGLPSVPQNLGPMPTSYLGQWVKSPRRRNFTDSKKRGAVEGPIRILSDSLSFLFNALAIPSISSKSLKFQSVLFSIPTAPTNRLATILVALRHCGQTLSVQDD